MKAFNQLKYLLLAVIMCTPLMLTGCKTPSKVKDPTTDPFATDPTAPAVSANYATAEQMQHVTGEKVASAGGSVTAHPGGRITYKLHITNNNNVPITVKVTDTLPIGTVLVSGCDNATGSNLSWEVDSLAAGAKRLAAVGRRAPRNTDAAVYERAFLRAAARGAGRWHGHGQIQTRACQKIFAKYFEIREHFLKVFVLINRRR